MFTMDPYFRRKQKKAEYSQTIRVYQKEEERNQEEETSRILKAAKLPKILELISDSSSFLTDVRIELRSTASFDSYRYTLLVKHYPLPISSSRDSSEGGEENETPLSVKREEIVPIE
jgi:hypothetical protein